MENFVSPQGQKSTEKADLLAKYANKFVDDFYFQCTANKIFKALQDALSKEEKDKTQPGMETESRPLKTQR